MHTIKPIHTTVDTVSPEVQQLAHHLASIIVIAGQIFAAKMPKQAPSAPEPDAAPGLLSSAKLARAIGKSVPTVGKLVAEGMPHLYVGDVRRFDLVEVRQWLQARGKKPTKAKASVVDNIDVSATLARNGLKAVGS